MIISLTFALIAASCLSMLWPSTRLVGIISLTVLTFLFPIQTLPLILVGILIYLYKRR